MGFKLCASDIPAALKDSILMPLNELDMILNAELPTAIRLTRSNVAILKRVLESRKNNQFDYEIDEKEEDITIEMNYIVLSPRHWSAADFAELFTI
jgi:hypothetical protein